MKRIRNPVKPWNPGDARVEPYMPPVRKALERHLPQGDDLIDIYNRAYEAVHHAIRNAAERCAELEAKNDLLARRADLQSDMLYDLNTYIRELRSKGKALEAENAEVLTEWNAASGRVARLAEEKGALEAKVADLLAEIADLQGQLDAFA